jgi:hypothetical protein
VLPFFLDTAPGMPTLQGRTAGDRVGWFSLSPAVSFFFCTAPSTATLVRAGALPCCPRPDVPTPAGASQGARLWCGVPPRPRRARWRVPPVSRRTGRGPQAQGVRVRCWAGLVPPAQPLPPPASAVSPPLLHALCLATLCLGHDSLPPPTPQPGTSTGGPPPAYQPPHSQSPLCPLFSSHRRPMMR